MKSNIRRRSIANGFKESLLPKFTPAEIRRIKGTFDYFGVNSYTGALARYSNTSLAVMGFYGDIEASLFQPSEWLGTGTMKVKM